MHHRGLKVAVVAVFTLVLVLGFAGIASAAGQWSDLSLSILNDYQITELQVAAISDGFDDGSWKPYMNIPRRQFVKMAVDAFEIPLVSPATPTYSDVPATNYYYRYVEAATAANLTNGVGGGKFNPDATITRQEATTIIARWVAAKHGYNLDTMYTAAEVDALLADFGDASAITPAHRTTMAFAIDFGIVWGDMSGMLSPVKAVTRIQAAAMLIRAKLFAPPAEPVVPTKIELVSDDEAENLIGLTHQYTFKVTQADGSAAPGVLVDFDTLLASWYVGNIQPKAAMTDADGEVTVNLISTEVGIQRVSAAVNGLNAIWTTKYWLALDEVYILDPALAAQNNAGVDHTWEARVLVFGPGPLSTSQSDWYNLYDPAGDPAQPMPADGVDAWEDYNVDYTQYADEVDWLADGYLGRSLAGIPVHWEIVNVVEDNPLTTSVDETVPSVGAIVAATEGPTTPANLSGGVQHVWAKTDADGLTSVTLHSTEAGRNRVIATADYVGNPYEGLLFSHATNNDYEEHNYDWDPQPAPFATAVKTWIPHVFGDNDTIIDPAYTYANIGEEFILTATLEDVYGNPIKGKQVEWFMQGIGHFVTDDDLSISDPTDPAGNKDIDVTDAAGQARLHVKSLEPGEQIIHIKFRDKGINGNEGMFMTFDAEVQWFDVDVATFDDPTTDGTGAWVDSEKSVLDYNDRGDGWDAPYNEALASNYVGTTHDFTLHVYGLKLEYDPWWQLNGFANNQTPIIDTDAAGHSYDGIFDWRDAEYLGGILLVNEGRLINGDTAALANGGARDLDGDGVIEAVNANGDDERGTNTWGSMGVFMKLSLEGGITRFDWDGDGYKEPFQGQTGIYLPLAGKDVTFDLVDNYIGEMFDEDGVQDSVGTFTPATDVTDENGEAVVTVSSTVKGPETVEATVDWEDNPHNMSELVQAYAKKIWVAKDWAKIVVSIDDTDVADSVNGELATPINPVWVDPALVDNVPAEAIDPETGMALNHFNVEVHVYDQYGNDLPDYEVVYLLENLGTTLQGKQSADNTYLPLAYLADLDTLNMIGGKQYDTNGTQPDHDEPVQADDPYAYIKGGPSDSFYFNQWLGAGYDWLWDTKNVDEGVGFYFNDPDNVPGYVKLPPMDKGPFFSNYVDRDGVGLITDGAKAWTMDGYFRPEWGGGDVYPNLLTGSNIDVQLLEDPQAVSQARHAKTIVKVMVYAPADGLVVDQAPIWHYQIHKVWYIPVPTTIQLTPSRQMGIAGVDTVSVSATVLDQQGKPMAGVPVTFTSVTGSEGNIAGQAGFVVNTTTNGVAVKNYGLKPIGGWGQEKITATVGAVSSNTAVIDWGLYDNTGLYASTANGSQVWHFTAAALFDPWDGKVVKVYQNPAQAAIGTGTYNLSNFLNITTSYTFATGNFWYANCAASTDTDGAPNWLYGVTP